MPSVNRRPCAALQFYVGWSAIHIDTAFAKFAAKCKLKIDNADKVFMVRLITRYSRYPTSPRTGTARMQHYFWNRNNRRQDSVQSVILEFTVASVQAFLHRLEMVFSLSSSLLRCRPDFVEQRFGSSIAYESVREQCMDTHIMLSCLFDNHRNTWKVQIHYMFLEYTCLRIGIWKRMVSNLAAATAYQMLGRQLNDKELPSLVMNFIYHIHRLKIWFIQRLH